MDKKVSYFYWSNYVFWVRYEMDDSMLIKFNKTDSDIPMTL